MNIVNDPQKSIEVMHNVGTWMQKNGLNPSKWWQPENMNQEFLFKHAEPEEFYCLLENQNPAGSVILQESERNQSWQPIDGEDTKKALYVHWLCVHRDFAGHGIPQQLIDFAKTQAQERGFPRLRLDTDANEEKLCGLYEGMGFKLAGTENEGDHTTAFYEMNLNKIS